LYQFIVSGNIYEKSTCISTQTNHYVTLVGYREGKWIIRDSWMRSLKNKNKKSDEIYLPWRSNFFKSEGGKCFCGGVGIECSAFYVKFKD